jgi:hypothetical protein
MAGVEEVRLMKTLLLALLFALLVALAVPAQPSTFGQPSENPPAPMADLVFIAEELIPAVTKGIGLFGEELTMAERESGSFTSRTVEAPIPFNAVVPQWTGTNPLAIELQMRTSLDGRTWSDWSHSHAHADWMEPDAPEVAGEMVLVTAPEERHEFVQFQILFEPEEGEELPALRELRLTFIDSTAGPTTEELILRQQELEGTNTLLPESQASYPKPFIVSRAVWCTHADCIYSEGLEYHPVSHLIVHHTVSSNASTNWAAVVRAIWNFHTYNRGWGDIGYNYLVDPQGVIYEGHYGGDDVVGTHASGANKGSMAVALLGTFTQPDQSPPGIRPPQPMLDSAVEILSWKAAQRNINIFEASRSLPNISWGLPHLMGHRDVYGTTACPGDQAHLLIPWMRDQIAGRIGLVDPHIYADELSPAFTRSQTGVWFEPPYLCGYNNHSWYTWSVINPGASANWGEWRPNVPAAGRYLIEVYAPYCRTGRAETQGATYTIIHAGGTNTRTANHNANVGLWMSLGEFNLNQGNGNVIRLTDLTTTDSGVGVWFDAIRLRPIDAPPPPPPPTVNNIEPTIDAWRTSRAVAFTWQVINPQSVTMTTLQVAVDPGFNNVLINQSWAGVVTTHNHTFGADYADLYWRVLLSRANAPLISSVPTHFGLDATPPVSAVRSPLFFLPAGGQYHLEWSGTDTLSGVDRYHIEFRPSGGLWTRWLTDTRLRSATFSPPVPGLLYEFRSLAIDRAGNSEPAGNGADARTDQAVTLDQSGFLPAAWR